MKWIIQVMVAAVGLYAGASGAATSGQSIKAYAINDTNNELPVNVTVVTSEETTFPLANGTRRFSDAVEIDPELGITLIVESDFVNCSYGLSYEFLKQVTAGGQCPGIKITRSHTCQLIAQANSHMAECTALV